MTQPVVTKYYSVRTKSPFDKRKETADKIKATYPSRIPVICEPGKSCHLSDYSNLKVKFLIPSDHNFSQFINEFRKKNVESYKDDPSRPFSAEKALFFFTDSDTIPPTGALMSQLYERYKAEDGFLYFTFNGENVFGDM